MQHGIVSIGKIEICGIKAESLGLNYLDYYKWHIYFPLCINLNKLNDAELELPQK